MPVFKRKSLAVAAWFDVGGNHGCFDKESSRSAHGIYEGAVAAPSALEDYSGGKHLVDGGFGLRLAPAALVERFARRVERQSDTVAVDVDVDHDIGIVETDTGSLVRTETVFEIIDNRVLYAIGHKARVCELRRVGCGVD